MRIAQVCKYNPPARDQQGAERIVERLTQGLIALGHDVSLVTSYDELEPSKYDVLHFHGWDPFKYADYGRPWVTTIHGYNLHQHHDFAVGNPSVVAVSQFAAQRFGAIQHVWNCSNSEEFMFEPHKDDYMLWMAGTDWGEKKGLFTTIALAKRLRCRLKIAGTGNNKDLIDAIKEHCDDRIEYIGPVNGAQKVKVLQKARALVLLTQLPDACPVTVSEALMCGTPVIGSCLGSMPEIVKHNRTGIICSSSMEATMAMARIQRIKPEECRKYALENFSVEACAKKYVNVYNKVIKEFTKSAAPTSSITTTELYSTI